MFHIKGVVVHCKTIHFLVKYYTARVVFTWKALDALHPLKMYLYCMEKSLFSEENFLNRRSALSITYYFMLKTII